MFLSQETYISGKMRSIKSARPEDWAHRGQMAQIVHSQFKRQQGGDQGKKSREISGDGAKWQYCI